MAKRFPYLTTIIGPAGLIAALICLPALGCARNSSPSGADPGTDPGADQASPNRTDNQAGPTQRPDQSAGAPAEPAAGITASPGDIGAVTAEEVDRAIKPHLRAGETLAHQVFRGPLGPARDTALVIVDRDGNAGGFVVIPDGAGSAARRMDLPNLAMGLLDSVVAVFFMDVDSRPGLEIVIMTKQMTGAGPQGAIPRHMNLVLSWTGRAFVRLTDVEERILDMDTAAAIKKTLARSSGAASP